MQGIFSLAAFRARYPTDEACLEEIKRLRFPKGIYCYHCSDITAHYKLSNRTAYSCSCCRHHVYPLAGTIFEKSTTPLRLWFYAFYLMTQTRGAISVKQLQRELGVTYKTAWRMYQQTYLLMAQNNGDLLKGPTPSVHKWVFFNKIELKVTRTQAST